MHHNVDAVVVDTEEFVCFDDFQAFVHQSRRIDGDLRPHFPRGMGKSVLDGDSFELGTASCSKRPAARRQDDSRDLGGDAIARSQALMDRAVLAVHGDDLGTRGRPQRTNDGTCSDQRLLVGQCQPLSLAQRLESHVETSETDHSVDDDVGTIDQFRHRHPHVGPREGLLHHVVQALVSDGHHIWLHESRLLDQCIDGRPDTQTGHFVHRIFAPTRSCIVLRADDIQCLTADRAGRAGNGDANGIHRSGQDA